MAGMSRRGRVSRNPDPKWALVSQEAHPTAIGASYDHANRGVKHSHQTAHFARLRDAVRDILLGNAHAFALADVAAKAVAAGLPVDPHAIFAPEEVLRVEARYLCLAIPSLANLHGDARLWLAEKFKRDPKNIEGSVPFNLALGGKTINETGA